MKQIPELFIIESLRFEEEGTKLEGHALRDILAMSGKVGTKYYYIRTRIELDKVIELFDAENFRYLHFSLHGSEMGIGTTLESISNEEFFQSIGDCVDNKRVFFSGCEIPSTKMAKLFFKQTDVYSLIGPATEVNFGNSAAFWHAFYTLMFEVDPSQMKHSEILKVLKITQKILGAPIHYYRRDINKSSGYRLHKIPDRTA